MALDEHSGHSDHITLFLCGDVMTGRGIDQILPNPSDPALYESWATSSKDYVELAEKASGPISRPVDFSYIWGDALEELAHLKPDVRIANLETSITTSDDYWPGKGINYRMHPKNITCLTAAKFDCFSLANNHVLDWGYAGLKETLVTLDKANIKHAGAGLDSRDAEAPAIVNIPGKGRVLVFACGTEMSGIYSHQAATKRHPGVNLLPDLSDQTIWQLKCNVAQVKQPGDIVVVSIHWGGNWGYSIHREDMAFAHKLIDEAQVDVIHGHSSHHAKGIEIYKEKLILYGCGDFLNDYEGIGDHAEFRDDLALMYLVFLDKASARVKDLRLIPFKIQRFRLNHASHDDARWLTEVLNRESLKFGTRFELSKENLISVKWN